MEKTVTEKNEFYSSFLKFILKFFSNGFFHTKFKYSLNLNLFNDFKRDDFECQLEFSIAP